MLDISDIEWIDNRVDFILEGIEQDEISSHAWGIAVNVATKFLADRGYKVAGRGTVATLGEDIRGAWNTCKAVEIEREGLANAIAEGAL